MLFFNLGNMPGQHSMLIFHALARMGIEALVLASPDGPLASIGYFQDAAQEVDLRYCRESRIPFMRREVGGGATYLDGNQIFYQLIWRKDNPRFPRAIHEIYPWFSQAPVETYRAFGIQAEYRSVNDIVTKEGRKIAGEGGGNIGPCMVFVGGILMDFDYRAMSRILKVPDEKFRDKVFKTMEENVTTMKKELGSVPPREDIVDALKQQFERILGTLKPASLNNEILEKMILLERKMTSDEFLFKRTPKVPKGVKIREGVELYHGLYKAKGGLIRTTETVAEGKIEEITITGDFSFFPKERFDGLEKSLEKSPLAEDQIVQRVERYYEEKKIESPGVESRDYATTILGPIKTSPSKD